MWLSFQVLISKDAILYVGETFIFWHFILLNKHGDRVTVEVDGIFLVMLERYRYEIRMI